LSAYIIETSRTQNGVANTQMSCRKPFCSSLIRSAKIEVHGFHGMALGFPGLANAAL
jgi:hypothetical protein